MGNNAISHLDLCQEVIKHLEVKVNIRGKQETNKLLDILPLALASLSMW